MLKMVNNKIFISRGETGTLDIEFKGSDGKPYLVPNDVDNVELHFNVKDSSFKGGKTHLKLIFTNLGEHFKTFSDLEIEKLENDVFDDTYATESDVEDAGYELDKLYSYNKEYKYLEYNEDESYYEWVDYSLYVLFNFLRQYTKDLEMGKYVFEFTLVGDGGDFKKTLIKSEFNVEGSLYE